MTLNNFRRWPSRALFVCFLAALLLCNACRTLKPERPPEDYSSAVSYAPKDSYINIPVGADVKSLEKLINRELKGIIYNDTSFEDNNRDNLMIRATKSGEIRISLDRNQMSYRIPLKIWLRKRITAGVLGYSFSTEKDATAEIVLRFKTAINLNKDWTLGTVTVSDGYDWISYPQVMLGPMKLPLPVISDLLVKSNQPEISRQIDQTIKEMVNLKSIMSDAWVRIQKPVLVSPENSLWLKITPVDITTVPVLATGSFLNQTVGLKARVELYYGQEPSYMVNPNLPSLKVTSSIPEKFTINFSLEIPFVKINEIAREQIKGYTLNYLRYKVIVTDISIYGKGEDLIVALMLDGSVKGMVYLSGKPVYDPATSTVTLSELDYSLSTRNVLTKTASWLFHGGLVQKLRENLVFPVGGQLNDARQQLAGWLSKEQMAGDFRIRGDINRLEPEQILITPEALRSFFLFEGKIKVSLRPE